MDLQTVFQLLNLIMSAFTKMLISPIFWLIVGVVFLQYNRIAKQKQSMFGIKGESVWPQVLIATGHGIIGGLVGSVMIVAMGVSLSGIGIQYLWLLAITLMLINPRFLCFAYAGGIIAFSYIIFGWPEVDIPQLMGLVAILHMVESVLIYVSGHLGALPMYTKLGKDRIVGGFTMQKFWPIPLVALYLMIMPDLNGATGGIDMPDWWPLIKPGIEGDPDNFIYALFPVAAALGYGDLALSSSPREKSKKSAIYLGSYSLVLLGLAVIASYNPLLAILPALFSPLGHEIVIKMGRDVEFKGKPKYVPPEKGIMILEVLQKSAASKLGLKTGDIIMTVNGYHVNSKSELADVLYWGGTALEVEYVDSVTNEFKREVARKSFKEDLGVILVPEGNENYYAELSTQGFLRRWLDKRRNKDK